MSYANKVFQSLNSLLEKKETSEIEQALIDDLRDIRSEYDMKTSTREYIENTVISSAGSFADKPAKKEIVDKNDIKWLFKKKKDGNIYVYKIYLVNGKEKLDTFIKTM